MAMLVITRWLESPKKTWDPKPNAESPQRPAAAPGGWSSVPTAADRCGRPAPNCGRRRFRQVFPRVTGPKIPVNYSHMGMDQYL